MNYTYRQVVRPPLGQVFLYPSDHKMRGAFHQISNEGITVACIILNPKDEEMVTRFNESLEIATKIYKDMFGG